jgi:Fur family peroxide stress response transcriptional regulator
MNKYTDILRAYNLKATPQRLEIANALYTHGHINTENLYTLMLEKFNSISLATIYKNINIMLETNFIQEVKIPNAKSVYELTKTVHSHIVCSNCGSIEDITIDLSTLKEDAAVQTGFIIKASDLVFSGICKNCQ